MMRMERVRGMIEGNDNNRVIVVCEKTGDEFIFAATDFDEPVKGEKVDLLCAPSDDTPGLFNVISIKSKKKIKPLKMANFNTLVSHMIKTRDRLHATLNDASHGEGDADIKDKIAWLEKGISLFS